MLLLVILGAITLVALRIAGVGKLKRGPLPTPAFQVLLSPLLTAALLASELKGHCQSELQDLGSKICFRSDSSQKIG